MLCILLYLPLKYQRVIFGAFVTLGFNTKQLDGLVGKQEDTVVPLRVRHLKSSPSISRPDASGSAVWEFCVNANADET